MFIYRYGVLILILISSFNLWAGENICATGNRTNIANIELKQALIDELRKDGIDFELAANGDICYAPNYKKEVTKRIISLDLKLRPPNQIKIASGPFAIKVLERLDSSGIKYKFSTEQDENVLFIVNDEDIDTAVSIIDDLAMEMFPGEK